ncbi:MAG: insulinase family protein [Ruminococcaceae bacterium]|nr:insulinase family protein [Oscillospiraceae bacterium]
MEKTTLIINNGKWRLHAVRTDKFKMSQLSFNFIIPKDVRRSPMTKLMLAVMLRGSEKYPTVTDINKRLDELYDATVSLGGRSFGDKSVFTLTCKVINDRFVFDGDDANVLSGTLDVVADILNHPVKDKDGLLLEQYVESEKKIAIDAINSIVNDQRAYAAKKCAMKMFEGSPYGITTTGDVDTVSSFTSRELTENIEYFCNNALVECYYIGQESPERISELIGDRFDCFGASSAYAKYGESAFIGTRTCPEILREEMDVAQTRICMGYTCGTTLCDEDYFPMVVANEIFGASSVSKLFMNVRERKSLCYYCYSSYRSATGTIFVDCGVTPANCDAAIDEITHQLSIFCDGEVSDNEIETAKRTLISGFTQISDSPASMKTFMFRRLMAGVDHTPQECIERIRSVSREDILRAAKRIKLDTVYILNGCDGGEESCDE